ncbi:MAG: pyridoxal-phosphate dependent enzyme, partial [Solirubrobacterales bacterium]
MSVGIDQIESASETIADEIRDTPVLAARELGHRVGAPVFLKAENLQRTGSFKLRGALNKIAS